MSETTLDTSDISHDQHAVRLAKLRELQAAGRDPFRASFAPTHFSGEALAAYAEAEQKNEGDAPSEPAAAAVSEAGASASSSGSALAASVAVAGRLVVIRDMGKSQFVKLLDQQGQIQLYVKKDEVGEEAYAAFKRLDLGDIIGAAGPLFKTKTGEVTVRVERYTLLAKALRPLPEKWHGLADTEQIYRQRYLDLIVNADSRRRLVLRSRIVSHIRRFLEARHFIEVETPVLENTAGGAAARPFVTHHNALDTDFYLRIATELRLKRLLVGGLDRVFEIGRIFRNEGVSRRHNPEFTMLEVYQAYSDRVGMMGLIKELLTSLCAEVLGTLQIPHAASGQTIDFAGEWREVRYKTLICEKTGDSDWFSLPKSEKIARATALGCKIDPAWEDYEVTNEIFSKLIEPTLIQPTFVTHLPKELCPLAKLDTEDSSTIDVFELTIGPPTTSKTTRTCSARCLRRKREARRKISTTTSCSHSNTGCHQRAAWVWGSTACASC